MATFDDFMKIDIRAGTMYYINWILFEFIELKWKKYYVILH